MTITICGSIRFAKEMEEWKQKLVAKGYEVFIPSGLANVDSYKEAGSAEEATKRKIANNYIRSHYELIKKSEGVLILNYDKDGVSNYVGSNSLMEMGFAYTLNRDIFLLNPVPNIPSSAEINAMQPIILNGDADQIDEYYSTLPKVYLSSESVIKVKATSLGLREFNERVSVVGFKTKSGISEQPLTFEEADLGARNRLDELKKLTSNQPKPKYYVSIESGLAKLTKNYSNFGFSVCIIEDEKGKRAVTIDTDLEIPKSLTDLVPSQYPDLGVLVQQKYGIEKKDPYEYFTKGKVTRDRFVFNSVVNTFASI